MVRIYKKSYSEYKQKYQKLYEKFITIRKELCNSPELNHMINAYNNLPSQIENLDCYENFFETMDKENTFQVLYVQNEIFNRKMEVYSLRKRCLPIFYYNKLKYKCFYHKSKLDNYCKYIAFVKRNDLRQYEIIQVIFDEKNNYRSVLSQYKQIKKQIYLDEIRTEA